MKPLSSSTLALVAACSLAACASTPKGDAAAAPTAPATAFAVRTTPAGAAIETTQGYRCTSPCQVPLNGAAFTATVTLIGYKPVQIPVAAGKDPGTVDIKLVPQDPGATAPSPVK